MSAALKLTPLADTHIASGARMVDFGGWSMPLAYGSQLEEHHAVRRDAGMFDVSHMLNVDLTGADAFVFLRRLVANDVARLATPGKALYTCMLNAQGGVIDDLIIYFFTRQRWRVVVNAGTADTDVAWMRQVAADESFAVDITPRRDLAMIAVQGPQARARLWAARPGWQAATEPLTPFTAAVIDDNTLVARTGYTGEDGFEVVLPASESVALWRELAAHGVRPCGLGARDTLRLEAGMNLYGQDMDETILPGQAGLSWTVSLKDTERNFIGRDAVEHGKTAAFLGVQLLDRGVMRSHMKIRTAAGEGEITSGTMSPTLGVSIGFARLPVGAQAGDAAEVEVRGKWLAARLCRLPFVRNGQPVVHA